MLLSGRVTPELHDEVVARAKEAEVTQSDYVAAVMGWYVEQIREGRRVVSLGNQPDGFVDERELQWPSS